jgi:hypothetical protein
MSSCNLARLLVILGFSQATAQELPAGHLVGCKIDDENSFHVVQIRAIASAARANKRKIRMFQVFFGNSVAVVDLRIYHSDASGSLTGWNTVGIHAAARAVALDQNLDTSGNLWLIFYCCDSLLAMGGGDHGEASRVLKHR